jgi:cytochrome P450
MSELNSESGQHEIDFLIDIPTLGDRILDRLDRMRAVDPIFWSEKNKAWMITGHTEVSQGYQGRFPLSSKRLPQSAIGNIPESVQQEKFPEVLGVVRNWLLNMDNPEHQRLKKLISKAFSRPVVELNRPDAKLYVKEALDHAAKIDGPIEFLETIGRTIPARLILRQLGLDDSLIPRLHHWSVVMNALGAANLSLETFIAANDVVIEMRELLEPQFNSRREKPTNDFLSMLVTAQEDGSVLTNDEVFSICNIVLVAGQDTTTNTMALGIAALARDQAALKRFREEPAILSDALMEIQRRIAMSMMMSRIASEDFDWKGHRIAKGDFVLLFQAAANRDPAVFPDAARLDFNRKQTQNLSFAPGVHHCAGFLLAKMVLSEFFPVFLDRFDFEVLDTELKFSVAPALRALERLNIRLYPRSSADRATSGH